MTFEDKTLICRDCEKSFVFTVGEQEFFAAKELANEPKRCPNCRILTRLQRSGQDPSQCSDVPCEECGVITRVPFKPTGARPVYCSSCFRKQNSSKRSTEG
ncbi:MAG: zinc-ribbon domain containing protein [Cyanobacteria bacterium SZAS LIN-5]|nr:zinc-ribbon domain containing protein [Cyanobacteria bacterium SZAS LIN-5]